MSTDKKGIVEIHGNEYTTVARRLELAQEAHTLEGIETEILNHDPVVIRAKVTIKGTVYTGISAVNLASARTIEKTNPYEVAETSAVGRALGFAGYGSSESVASADEVQRAEEKQPTTPDPEPSKPVEHTVSITESQKLEVITLLGKKGKKFSDLSTALEVFAVTSYQQLTATQAETLLIKMRSLPDKEKTV